MSQDIILHRTKHCLQIQIHRPAKRNALTQVMYAEMTAALHSAENDPDIRCVIIRGDDKCFTSGNDLGDFLSNPNMGTDSPVFLFLQCLSTFNKPLIAAVAGAAIGIGTTILLHCDFVYAANNTIFQMPFVNLGLCPEAAASLLVPQNIGQRRANELLLLGEKISASKAEQWGLINRALEVDELFACAEQCAARIAALPPAAVRDSKALMKRATQEDISETILAEAKLFSARLHSDEAKEAMNAFMQKRPADFSKFV